MQSRIHAAYEHNARYYNLRGRPLEFFEGDVVSKKELCAICWAMCFTSKLVPRFIECKDIKKVSKTYYLLKDLLGLGIWHIIDLKLALDEDDHPESSE